MPIIPGQDPDEAYDVVLMKHWPRGGWWTVTCNGIPLHHFAPEHNPVRRAWKRTLRWTAEGGERT